MTHIKTPSGFEADIDEEKLDDYRLFKAIREAETAPVAVVDVVAFVLGDEEQKLIDHLIATQGRPSFEAMKAELAEIFAQLNERKKK